MNEFKNCKSHLLEEQSGPALPVPSSSTSGGGQPALVAAKERNQELPESLIIPDGKFTFELLM